MTMDECRRQLELLEQNIIQDRYPNIQLRMADCKALLQQAKELGLPDKETLACAYLGRCYLRLGDNLQAGPCLLQALDAARRTGPAWLLCNLLTWTGSYYLRLNDELSAVRLFSEGIDVAEQEKDLIQLGFLHKNIAVAFAERGAYQQAAAYFELACQYGADAAATTPGKNRFMHGLLTSYAHTCIQMGEADIAWSFLELCNDYPSETLLQQATVLCARVCCLSAQGHVAQAGQLLDNILALPLHQIAEQYTLCGVLFPVAEAMRKNKDAYRCRLLLDLLENYSATDSLNLAQQLYRCWVDYAMAFGTEQEQVNAFCRFYQGTQEFEKASRQVRTQGMKIKIELHETLWKIQAMEEEASAKAPQLEQLANRDELTGLYSRRYFNRIISELTDPSSYLTVGFLLLDVDFFKEYNDYYGHASGDVVLQAVAACMQEACPKGVCPCRYGGDEFACLCINQTHQDILQYIQQIQQLLEKRALWHCGSKCSSFVTLSIGYCNRPVEAITDLHALLDLADKAMYTAKLSGRDGFARLD